MGGSAGVDVLLPGVRGRPRLVWIRRAGVNGAALLSSFEVGPKIAAAVVV